MNEFIVKVKGLVAEVVIEDKSGPSMHDKSLLIAAAVTNCTAADQKLRRPHGAITGVSVQIPEFKLTDGEGKDDE